MHRFIIVAHRDLEKRKKQNASQRLWWMIYFVESDFIFRAVAKELLKRYVEKIPVNISIMS